MPRKITDFVINKKAHLFSFGLPIVILIITYIAMGMSPFGEKSILTLDMDGQYVYFFEQFRDVFTGQASLFYTFERSLGGEFLGLFAYYLASPLSFLVVIFPATAITETIMLIFLLKSGFAGLTFSIYLSKTRKMNSAGFVMFSVMYALCSYSTMYQFNTMWMDALIWLPLIVLGIEKLATEGKFKLFIISLAMAICSNYYIGYMLCIFVAIYFFAFILSKPSKDLNGLNETNHILKSLIRIVVASVIALMISAAIILSVYYSLSLGKSGYQDNVLNSDLRFDLLHLLAKMFLGSYDTVRLDGTPNIYVGLLPLLLLPIFYFSKKVSAREKVVFTILALIFVTSFSINALDLIWHGFQKPIWFNNRYSFLFSFVILQMAYRGYEDLDDFSVPFVGKSVGVLAVLLIIVQKTVILTRYEFANGAKKAVETKPGLTMVWLSLLFLLLYLLIFFVRKRTLLLQITTIVLVMVSCSEALINSIINWSGELQDGGVAYRKNYRTYVDNLGEVTAELKEKDTGFYRTEHVFIRKCNDNMVLNINGISEFTSTFNASTVNFLGRLGFFVDSPTVEYTVSNPVTDSLLGIKYVIGSTVTDSNGAFKGNNSINSSYVPVLSKNGYVIYENPYALPLAFCVDKDMQKSYNETNFFNKNYSFASVTENLFNSMIGKDTDIFTVCEYSTNIGALKYIETDIYGGKTFASPDETKPTYFYFTVKALENGNIYMHLPSPYTTATKLYIDGNSTPHYSTFFQGKNKTVVDLGYFKKGETVTVKLEFSHYRLYLWDTEDYFVQINEENFANAINTLKSGGLRIEKHSDAHFKGTISSSSDSLVFTTIPYDKNWQVFIDGEKVQTVELVDALLGFDITEGEHAIEIKYVPSQFITGAIISGLGILIFIALIILDKYFGFKIIPTKKLINNTKGSATPLNLPTLSEYVELFKSITEDTDGCYLDDEYYEDESISDEELDALLASIPHIDCLFKEDSEEKA